MCMWKYETMDEGKKSNLWRAVYYSAYGELSPWQTSLRDRIIDLNQSILALRLEKKNDFFHSFC